jgi:hypothetical protein
MWAVVVVTVNLLAGPQAIVVTAPGTFKTEAGCLASIKASVPASLDAPSKAAFASGARKYVCVRVDELGALPPR